MGVRRTIDKQSTRSLKPNAGRRVSARFSGIFGPSRAETSEACGTAKPITRFPVTGHVDNAISDTDLPPLRLARRAAVDSFELSYLKALLAKADGNVTRAAALARVSRQAIHLLMTKHGL